MQAVTLAVSAPAGTGATVTCATGYQCGADSGIVKVVTGTSASTGDGITITWAGATAYPRICNVDEIAGSPSRVWADATTTTTVKLYAVWTSSSTYNVSYRCTN